MLISFSINNFRSFKTEQTLSLLASKRLGTTRGSTDCYDMPGTKEQALRVASVYGANAAGKSNLVQALAVLQQLVLRGTQPRNLAPFQPFLLDPKSRKKPTSFDLQFVEDGNVFRYGICYDASRVHEEWLSVYQQKKESILFSRVSKNDGAAEVTLGPAAKGRNSPSKIKSLADVGSRKNQSFLAEIVNLDDPKARGTLFQSAVNWLTSTLAVILADAPYERLTARLLVDKKFAKFAGGFLRDAGTGVDGLNVQVGKMSVASVPRNVLPLLMSLPQNQGYVLPLTHGIEMLVDGATKDAVKIRQIAAQHSSPSGDQTQFPFQIESDGTQRLLHLLPALYALLEKGGVFVVDELERSMHPMLARKFIEYFKKVGHKTKSQLIFTTHESTLLDQKLMRRDGIWFTEKDKVGATHLYSLVDFKVRNDRDIEKGYLTGRFGAIPFLGGIDRLMEEQTTAGAGA